MNKMLYTPGICIFYEIRYAHTSGTIMLNSNRLFLTERSSKIFGAEVFIRDSAFEVVMKSGTPFTKPQCVAEIQGEIV